MRNRTFWRLWIGVGILCVGLGLSLILMPQHPIAIAQDDGESTPAPSTPTADNSYCLVCHGQTDKVLTLADGTTYPLEVSNDVEQNLIHGIHNVANNNLGCVDCHGENAFPHVYELPTTKAEYEAAYVAPSEGSDLSRATCATCHVDSSGIELTLNFGDISSSEYLMGSSCQSCHQPTDELQAIHTSSANNLNVSVETCAECHTTTVNEWHTSAHGEQQLGCATCHITEEGRFRFDTVQELCLNCHENARDDFTHIVHVERACSDCHWDPDDNAFSHILGNGVWSHTGHDLVVETRTCVECHAQEDIITLVAASDEMHLNPSQHPLVKAQEQIETLEKEVETTRDDESTQATISLMQSLMVGLALGVISTVLVVRFNRRTSSMPEDVADIGE